MTNEEAVLTLGGVALKVRFRAESRANRMSLRIDQRNGAAVVVLPRGKRRDDALAFLSAHASWVIERLRALPPAVPFSDGAVIPLRGQGVTIRHVPEARRGVWLADGVLWVSGKPEHLPRRVRDWLRAEAGRVLVPLAHEFATRLGRKPGRIVVRDQRSRWGSCSVKGDLSFSWRLILAPDWVLAYVVAHEVAHMVHHDHSRRYWALLKTLTPDVARARPWLAENAARLHRVG